jgi:hypothetical protein
MKKYKRQFESLHYFLNINEAVIHTKRYQQILMDVFYSLFFQIPFNKTSEELINFLNSIFISYKIIFKLGEGNNKNGVVKGKSINEDIIVFVDKDFNEYFNNKFKFTKFTDTCNLIFAHELVHRGQFLQSIKHANLNKDISLEAKDLKYYSDRHEIMSFANMIIEELRFTGYDNDEILKGINEDLFGIEDSEFLFLYKSNFKNDKKVLNLLYKYIYMYLKEPEKVGL